MNLSGRLLAVSTLVDVNARVIDVGCDHAYLDIYLTLNNENECIATDINQNALSNAQNNISKYKLDGRIKTILTDGLSGITINPEDNIVISGMGTHTILDILKYSKLSDTLIISANNDIPLLREEVVKLGFIIDSELYITDKGKSYVIIKFIKGIKKYRKIDYEYGPILKYNRSYKLHLLEKNKKILKKIKRTRLFLRLKYRFIILKIKLLLLLKKAL